MTRDRLPASPFLAWTETRTLHPLAETERRAIVRARHLGSIDFYVADRICVKLGHPEMMRLLYEEVAA